MYCRHCQVQEWDYWDYYWPNAEKYKIFFWMGQQGRQAQMVLQVKFLATSIPLYPISKKQKRKHQLYRTSWISRLPITWPIWATLEHKLGLCTLRTSWPLLTLPMTALLLILWTSFGTFLPWQVSHPFLSFLTALTHTVAERRPHKTLRAISRSEGVSRIL